MSNEDFNDIVIQIKQCEKQTDVLKILHNILQTKHISNIQYKELTRALEDNPVNNYDKQIENKNDKNKHENKQLSLKNDNKIEYKPQNIVHKLQPLQPQSQFEKQHIQGQTQSHSQLKTEANTNTIDIEVNNTKCNDNKNVVGINSKNNNAEKHKNILKNNNIINYDGNNTIYVSETLTKEIIELKNIIT
eukprot:488106_1